MAQRAPIRYDLDAAERSSDTGLHSRWSDLRAVPISANKPPKSGSSLLTVLSLIVALGIAVAAIFFYLFQPIPYGDGNPAARNITSVKKSTKVILRRFSNGTKRSLQDARSFTTEPALSQSHSAVGSLLPTWPEVSPPAYLDVVSSSGHSPIRLGSVAYNVDVATGTVLLVHSGFESPVVATNNVPIHVTSPRALASTVEGTVVLRVVTDNRGQVREVYVMEGATELAVAAINAVRHWHFASPQDQNLGADRETTVSFSFASAP